MSDRAIAAVPAAPVDLSEVRAHRAVALPTQADITQLLNLGDMLVKSGLLPQSLRTKEAAATVVLKGHELGLPPMAALEGIAVVQGKAVVGAHLLLALVKREYGPGAIWVSETTNERCSVSYRIPGVPNVLRHTFTIEDAQRAGLADKPTWRQYPAAMLRARCISAAVKLAFPEVVGGVYVPGELPGTEAAVTEDGDVVIDVTAPPAEPEPAPEPRRQQARATVRPAQPARDDRPADAAPAELPREWVIRLGDLAAELPVVGDDRLAPAAVRRVQEEAMREVVKRVVGGGDGSRKYLTRAQATEVGRVLADLKAHLLADGRGLEPPAPEPAQAPIDADLGPAADAEADRWTN